LAGEHQLSIQLVEIAADNELFMSAKICKKSYIPALLIA
jgi:hypothetical protein